MTANDLPLLGRWIAARVRMMMRSPRALGFTFAFPLVLVTLFGSLNADQKVTSPSGVVVKFTQYYTPAIGVFALTLACYTSLIIGVATARDYSTGAMNPTPPALVSLRSAGNTQQPVEPSLRMYDRAGT